jgi:hypothetical protein
LFLFADAFFAGDIPSVAVGDVDDEEAPPGEGLSRSHGAILGVALLDMELPVGATALLPLWSAVDDDCACMEWSVATASALAAAVEDICEPLFGGVLTRCDIFSEGL